MTVLQKQVYNHVLSACGVPSAMYDADSPGTARRESYRQFIELTVDPLLGLLADELTEMMEAPVAFSTSGLHSWGRGRTRKLVSAIRGRRHGDRARRGSFRAADRRLTPGLSPRVRGNRRHGGPDRRDRGSIPACAGKPTSSRPWVAVSRVYPRVCGEPPVLMSAAALYWVYPRVCGETSLNPSTVCAP